MAFKFLKNMFKNGNGPGSDLLLPADQFRTLILHECARCDRNAHAFSLIHIDLRGEGNGNGKVQNGVMRELARKLVRRMRTTDEVGWMDVHSIGVFLPETGNEGARSFATSVCNGYSYQIYTYPWLGSYTSDRDGRGPEDRGTPPKGRWRSDAGEDDTRQPENDEVQLTLHCQGGDVTGTGLKERGPVQPVRNLEELFLPAHPPAWKRAYDIFGATVLLTAFSPVFALVALYIKAVSPGPVFFRQERMGYMGRSFSMVKFRTMKMGSDNVTVHKNYLKDLINTDGRTMKKLDTGKDDRLIPLAGLLRRSCIDELPQLFNVLKGDMSLVGPRPCLDYEADEFTLWQRRRFHSIPGMTGLWQVSGKNRLSFKEMMRLDIRYANRKSAFMDVLISIKTVPAILGQVRDAVQAKRSVRKVEGDSSRLRPRWSLDHLIRQLFL